MGRKRITQTKLGEILGIPQASIYRRLNGKISFSFNELLIIASYMGITVGELVGSGLLNAKSSTPLQVSQEGRAGKKIAPVEMISTGATYEVVAGAGFEPCDLRVMSPASYRTAPPRGDSYNYTYRSATSQLEAIC